jgi:hypothetical protein
LFELIETYEAQSPEFRLDPLRLVVSGTNRETQVAGTGELPGEADLASLTIAKSVVTLGGVDVTTMVLLAARLSASGDRDHGQ